jgi:hypothetical protein
MVHPGQALICCEKPRRGDQIFVTEKLDGACMSVADIDGSIVALSRAGYRASDALYDHLRIFEDYVGEREEDFAAVLNPGERIVGEWLAMAHGTLYDTHHPEFSPFVVFDIFRDDTRRVLRNEMIDRVDGRFRVAHLVGTGPLTVDDAMDGLGGRGFHGATEQVEGAVWRVERENRVDFLAKFVRHDKIDGKYLPDVANAEPIWFWRPSNLEAA